MSQSTKVEDCLSLTKIPVYLITSPSTLTLVVCLNQSDRISNIYDSDWDIKYSCSYIFWITMSTPPPPYICLSLRKNVKFELQFDTLFVYKQIKQWRLSYKFKKDRPVQKPLVLVESRVMFPSLCHPCYRSCSYRYDIFTIHENELALDISKVRSANFIKTLTFLKKVY